MDFFIECYIVLNIINVYVFVGLRSLIKILLSLVKSFVFIRSRTHSSLFFEEYYARLD